MRETRVGIVAMARTLVPIDTGRLYRSIRPTFTGVEADTEYAGIIEYGLPPFRAPQPYLVPAANYYRPIMLRRLRDELFAEKDQAGKEQTID